MKYNTNAMTSSAHLRENVFCTYKFFLTPMLITIDGDNHKYND